MKKQNTLKTKSKESKHKTEPHSKEHQDIENKNLTKHKTESHSKEHQDKHKINLIEDKHQHLEHKTLTENKQSLEENKEIQKHNSKQVFDKYEIAMDSATVLVEIAKENFETTYNLIIPQINIATRSLLDDLRNELVSVTTISMNEILDPSSFNSIKKRFMNDAEKLLKEKLPNIEEKSMKFFIGILMQEMLGLGEIEFLVNDPNLEEIVILSAKEEIRVYHKKYKWIKTNIMLNREEKIINYAKTIARRVGREITVLNPLLDAHLVSGDRVNSILYPVSTNGNTITIRKFARDPYTIIDLIGNKTCDLEVACLLWLAIEYEMNILVSGGTASGKTVLLNSCLPFIPPNHRVVTVEDTRELILPDFLYWTPLVTRSANPEGKGEITMLDLLVNSLRMRPDRIIMGEMRRQQEAMVLFEAMHTGHSVYATLHADSASETISRLTNAPLNIPSNLLKSVNLNVVMFRDRKRGIRRILQLAEFESGDKKTTANILYRWTPNEDKIVKHSESSRFFEDISRITGMSENEIRKDLEMKKLILNWMITNKKRDLVSVGKVMNLYYLDREHLIESIKKNRLDKVFT